MPCLDIVCISCTHFLYLFSVRVSYPHFLYIFPIHISCSHVLTALGNTTEAQAILKRALPAMLMQSSDDFEAIGEAMFYDGLIDLDKAETAAAVEKTTKQLCKVPWWLL